MIFLLEALFTAGVVVIFIVGTILLTIPKRVFRSAFGNFRRADGTWSRKRIKAECREVGDLAGGLILSLVVAGVMTASPLLVVHFTVVPIPMVVDIFGAYDIDPVKWEMAIETGRLGDVGAQYEHWGAEKGYSTERLRFWQEFLWKSWPFVLGIGAVFLSMLYWFATRFYLKSAAAYGRGVERRRERYEKHDRRHR